MTMMIPVMMYVRKVISPFRLTSTMDPNLLLSYRNVFVGINSPPGLGHDCGEGITAPQPERIFVLFDRPSICVHKFFQL